MASSVRRYGGDFSSVTQGVILPVTGGIVGAYFLGGDADRSRRNWAPGGADAVVVGTPTYGAGYARLTGLASFLELDIPETSAMTLIALWRSVDAGAPNWRWPIGNLGSTAAFPSNTFGVGLRGTPASNQVAMQAGGNAGSPSALGTLLTGQTTTNWNIHAGTVDGVSRTLTNLTISATIAGSSGDRVINTERTLRIGSTYFASDTGVLDVSAALIASRVLTGAEISAVAAQMRARAAIYGITA